MTSSSKFRVFKMPLTGIAALGATWLVAASDAQADSPPPLPPEAYAACQSKQAGDTCNVHIHDRDIQGSCTAHPADGRLFCRPAGPPPPPPEAFDACNGKKAGDECAVSFHGHEMNGTCVQAPDARLVCAPPHPPGPPPGAGLPR